MTISASHEKREGRVNRYSDAYQTDHGDRPQRNNEEFLSTGSSVYRCRREKMEYNKTTAMYHSSNMQRDDSPPRSRL